MKIHWIARTVAVLAVLFWGLAARAYMVANSASLAELEREADLICKASVVATEPVQDAWFEPVNGFGPRATGLKIISVIKGGSVPKTISFCHYGREEQQGVSGYSPQSYSFEPGRTYIVLAKKTSDPKVFRQIWKSHRLREDQGVLLAADARPNRAKSLDAVFWTELTGLLKHTEAQDVIYAIDQLDWMSGGSYEDLSDFDRARVLAVIQPLIASADEKIAQAAITAMGSRNPYLSDSFAPHWLATIGHGQIEGFAEWDRDEQNTGGRTYFKELAAIVDSTAPAATRALAVRALGRAQQPAIEARVKRWLSDPAAEVRQAAALLLADYPDLANAETLAALAADASGLVRIGAARAIGFGRFAAELPTLGRLLHDDDSKVRRAAALSLLSFSVAEGGDIMRANSKHPEFAMLFVNALARHDPEPHLEALADIVRRRIQPANWWGGRIPWGVSWDILFAYAQRQKVEDLRGGSLDAVLDALESPAAGRAAGNGYSSSAEPRDLYALYLQRGLTERAKTFRARCRKSLSYDIDYCFDMVDKNPSVYQRR